MAEDARISTALPSHPKTRKLYKRLGGDGCWALICLFLWVAGNRSDGDLRGLTEEDIELAADWRGEAGTFIAALREVGFLDGEPGSFTVHDWAEHNPWAATRGKRVECAKRAAAVRWEQREDAVGMRSASDSNAERMRDVQKRNALHPTQPNQVKSSCQPPVDAGQGKVSEVIEIWNRTAKGTNLPSARLTEKRRKVIHARLREQGWFEDFTGACAFVRASNFHRGQNDRDWVANLDYVLQVGKATELADQAKAKSTGKPNGKTASSNSAVENHLALLREADGGIQ